MRYTEGKWTVKNGAYIGQYVIKEFDDKVNDLSLRKEPLLWDENDANKTLISAAPALLEALKETNAALKAEIEGGTARLEWKHTRKNAEQVIAQAEAE